jgi:hypothetical protein
MDCLRLIERSLWCYRAGWLSLVPILGVIPAVVAIHLYCRVRVEVGKGWNPGGGYLLAGLLLSLLGICESLFLIGIPFFKRLT